MRPDAGVTDASARARRELMQPHMLATGITRCDRATPALACEEQRNQPECPLLVAREAGPKSAPGCLI